VPARWGSAGGDPERVEHSARNAEPAERYPAAFNVTRGSRASHTPEPRRAALRPQKGTVRRRRERRRLLVRNGGIAVTNGYPGEVGRREDQGVRDLRLSFVSAAFVRRRASGVTRDAVTDVARKDCSRKSLPTIPR
jgi:hypothetical protein